MSETLFFPHQDPLYKVWYWVSTDGKKWFPAKYDISAMGGWTNEDTWEDFGEEIKYWVRIPDPDVIPLLKRVEE